MTEDAGYLKRLADYYRTAADNYRDMFGMTEEWGVMEARAERSLDAYQNLVDKEVA